MASLSKDAKGYRIRWYDEQGSRQILRLGKVSERVARRMLAVVENLVAARKWNLPPDPQTKKWLEEIDRRFVEKLVECGLLDAVKRAMLGEAATRFVERYRDAKCGHTVRLAMTNLVSFFGESRPLDSITVGDVEDYKRWLLTEAGQKKQGLAEATAAKHLIWACSLYRDAMRREQVSRNPFDEVVKGSQINRERRHYVPAEVIERVIDITPSLEWKLLLALARYAGLRVPSEPFSLTWDCVDWEHGMLRVPAPKTEKQGKPFRMVPLFPPIRPHLERLWEAAEPGTVYVLHELRQRSSMKTAEGGQWNALNLRTHLERLLTRAGVIPWPKLWQNLRVSAEMDLLSRFPPAAVCEWIGHTPDVARSHYYQIRPEDVARAINEPWTSFESSKVALKVAPQMHARQRTEKTDKNSEHSEVVSSPQLAPSSYLVQIPQMTPTGFEPVLQA